jgi:hypothetical protein
MVCASREASGNPTIPRRLRWIGEPADAKQGPNRRVPRLGPGRRNSPCKTTTRRFARISDDVAFAIASDWPSLVPVLIAPPSDLIPESRGRSHVRGDGQQSFFPRSWRAPRKHRKWRSLTPGSSPASMQTKTAWRDAAGRIQNTRRPNLRQHGISRFKNRTNRLLPNLDLSFARDTQSRNVDQAFRL